MATAGSHVTKVEIRELALALMRADDERDVVSILVNFGVWDNASDWLPYGGNESNQSVIGSQQSDAFAALVEKIINSVDAYLIMACLLAGIDPESSEAPQTMDEAIKRFGHIFTGQKTGMRVREAYEKGVSTRELTELARKIAVVVTGEQGAPPCMSIVDTATGQSPDDFPNTFLSLMQRNKVKIPFVQGKFNMGGSGVLRFCSEQHHLQLIVSRRNPALLGATAKERERMWGVTVVRKRPARPGERMSVYEYLAPKNAAHVNEILAFPSETMPLLPSESLRTACTESAEWGTFNKMYQYKWPERVASYSTQIQGKSTVMHLNINLPDAVMPVRVYELRGYGAANPTMNVYGLRARLEQNDDVRPRLEPEVPVAGTIVVNGFALPVRAYVFKFDDQRMSTYRGEYGVIFSLNGQKHGHLPETFFARKDVDLGVLRTKTAVVVDCDALDNNAREQILMNSRDRLADSWLASELQQQLADWLKKNEVLAILKRRHIEAQLAKTLAEDKPLAEMMRNLVNSNPDLAALFKHGSRIPGGPGGGSGAGAPSDFEGKDQPTFFRYRGGDSTLNRTSPINHAMNIEFETDVVNDFFTRAGALTAGKFTIVTEHPAGGEVSGVIGTLHDGCLQVRLKHPTAAVVDEEYKVRLIVAVPDTDTEFVNTVTVKVLPEATVGLPGGEGERGTTTTGKKGGSSRAGIDLPRIIPVYREEWAALGWNDSTALEAKMLDGKAEAFQINMDNRYLDQARRKKPKIAELLNRRFQFGLAITAVSIIANEEAARKELLVEATEMMSTEDLIRMACTSISQAVLPVIEVLGRLTEKELGDLAGGGDDE
jgi:hypothetical protein